jgi:membrane-anchored glycerophosphoryl diester phosphodiesterase (GDPDase)
MVKWQVLMQKVVVWLLMEMILDVAGLSQMANYGEFLSEHMPEQILSTSTHLVSNHFVPSH